MPKFKVKVTVRAERTYEVEVDAADWKKAEGAAAGMWRTNTGDDFQVDKVDVAEIDSEQLTYECVECNVEIPATVYHIQDEMCLGCYSKAVREDAEWLAARQHAKAVAHAR